MKPSLAVGCFGAIAGLAYIPISAYSWWLLLNHVHATDMMWLLFWFAIPIQIIIGVIAQVAKVLVEKEKEE